MWRHLPCGWITSLPWPSYLNFPFLICIEADKGCLIVLNGCKCPCESISALQNDNTSLLITFYVRVCGCRVQFVIFTHSRIRWKGMGRGDIVITCASLSWKKFSDTTYWSIDSEWIIWIKSAGPPIVCSPCVVMKGKEWSPFWQLRQPEVTFKYN